jgi:hypothetical protein
MVDHQILTIHHVREGVDNAASNEVALVAGGTALGPAAADLVAVFDKNLSEDEFQKRRQTFIDLAKADLGS